MSDDNELFQSTERSSPRFIELPKTVLNQTVQSSHIQYNKRMSALHVGCAVPMCKRCIKGTWQSGRTLRPVRHFTLDTNYPLQLKWRYGVLIITPRDFFPATAARGGAPLLHALLFLSNGLAFRFDSALRINRN